MPALPLCAYSYDPLDRLTSQAVAAQAPVQGFYCKSRLATEIEGAINRSIVQHDEQLLALTETQGNVRRAALLATDQQRSMLQALAADESQSCRANPNHHRKVFQKQQDLFSEIKLLKRAIPSNDDLKKPFTFPENKQAATEAYFAHQKAGIPFDKHGIPNPDRALTAPNESGTQTLRIDFFDDSIAFFHLQAHSKILPERHNEAFTRTMLESAGRTMERRLQYIRRYALRDY